MPCRGVHPATSFCRVRQLLKYGLGKMIDWSANMTSDENRTAMRAAEKGSKQQRLRIWRNWVPPAVQGDRDFVGTVTEVLSGDMMVVLVGAGPNGLGGEERRICLSSIRAPRIGNARRGAPDEPFAVRTAWQPSLPPLSVLSVLYPASRTPSSHRTHTAVHRWKREMHSSAAVSAVK